MDESKRRREGTRREREEEEEIPNSLDSEGHLPSDNLDSSNQPWQMRLVVLRSSLWNEQIAAKKREGRKKEGRSVEFNLKLPETRNEMVRTYVTFPTPSSARNLVPKTLEEGQ